MKIYECPSGHVSATNTIDGGIPCPDCGETLQPVEVSTAPEEEKR